MTKKYKCITITKWMDHPLVQHIEDDEETFVIELRDDGASSGKWWVADEFFASEGDMVFEVLDE